MPGWHSVRLLGDFEASIGARNRSKLVDQASSRPASRAVKTTSWPSGVKVNSSGPPQGFDGVSASMQCHHVDRRDFPAEGITNRCERRPSLQVSQWRTKSRS